MGQDSSGDGEWEGDLNLLYRLQTVQPARGEGQQGNEEAFLGLGVQLLLLLQTLLQPRVVDLQLQILFPLEVGYTLLDLVRLKTCPRSLIL